MVVWESIREEFFNFCPTCGDKVVRERVTYGHLKDRDILRCTYCGSAYPLQLEYDMG